MADKLIEGSINIEDKASEALSKIEQALKNIEKIAKPVMEQMKGLNKEISKFKTAPINSGQLHKDIENNLKGVTGFTDLSKARQFNVVEDVAKRASRHAAAQDKIMTASILGDVAAKVSNAKTADRIKIIEKLNERDQLQFINRSALLTEQESLRSSRQDAKFGFQRQLAETRYQQELNLIAEKEAAARRLVEMKKQDREQQKQIRMSEKLAQQEAKLAEAAAKQTDWQKRMAALAAKGGKLQPLWESFGKATSALNLARSPHLVTEGLGGVFGKLGSFGKGLGGFVTGRMVGGLLGSANIGGIIGGAVAGPVGMAIAATGTLLLAGIHKVVESVQEVCDILEQMSSERATESTSLRRKMQMSSEMFNVDPRNIKEIDKKIYGLRSKEQEYYKYGISGRDVVASSIDWLHLLGTKSTGGVFADEKQAFDFSEALSSIAKMNGLSAQEYETVRYQGMQILSKGYADILDIKPLLNSAPGFVRDLLQQTGMTREQFLEAGRNRKDPVKGFSADKFINALMSVKDYYAVLSERASSRTAEQQEEAAKNIVGAAAVWDELYKKNKAESNQEVANAIIRGGIAEDIKQSWYQMWSDTNDAADGALAKANLEKRITNDIMKGVLGTYVLFIKLKNMVDVMIDSVLWIVGQIGASLTGMFDSVTNGLLAAFGALFTWLGETMDNETLKGWGNSLNPNNEENTKKRAGDDLANKMADKIYEDYIAYGASYVREKYGYIFNKTVGEDAVAATGGMKKVIHDPHLSENKNGRWHVMDAGPAIIRKIFGGETGLKVEYVPEEYKYTKALNLGDAMLYASNAKDKGQERFIDKNKMKAFIREHAADFMEDGKFMSGYTMSAIASSEANHRSLAEDFGLEHDSISDYTWQAEMVGRHDWVNKKFLAAVENDNKDVKRAEDMMNKVLDENNKAMQNVKAPFIPKIAANTNDIKEEMGSGGAKILDVLKEIAGITVINKVTTVRPDVVFNFGSYGRNGKNEDPNLRAVGDKLASFYNNKLNSHYSSSVNGETVLEVGDETALA